MKIRYSESADREFFAIPDEDEISRLYLLYREQFIGFARKYYRLDRETAADIYQDCFLDMYRNITEKRLTRMSASLRTYLFQIGRHKIFNYFRSDRRTSGLEDCRPETGEYRSEEWARMQQLTDEGVSAMEEPCYSVLSLYYWERKSMAEIAAKMNYKNEQVAKNRKSLCMKKLKAALSVRFKEEGLNYE